MDIFSCHVYKVYHEVPSLKLTASLHLFKWMVVYQRLMVSKVVSTHLWNTPRATSTNRAMFMDSFHSCFLGDCLGCVLGVC